MPEPRLRWIWVLLSLFILCLDYATGPSIQFPILFVVPVMAISWHMGDRFGVGLALFLVVARHLYASQLWSDGAPSDTRWINTAIRLTVLLLIAVLVGRTAVRTRETKALRGLLPMCSFCRRIRDKDDSWKELEAYIAEHSESRFSHGFCPECANKHYGLKIDAP